MENRKIFDLLKVLDKYPIEYVCAKHIMMNGIKTEEELVRLLTTDRTLSDVWKNKLQNAFRDIERGFTDINKIPTLFK
jgi:hypothetical protein